MNVHNIAHVWENTINMTSGSTVLNQANQGRRNKHGLNKVGQLASWPGKADGMFWNILEGFYPRVFLDKCQVDRFNKVGTDLVLVKQGYFK